MGAVGLKMALSFFFVWDTLTGFTEEEKVEKNATQKQPGRMWAYWDIVQECGTASICQHR